MSLTLRDAQYLSWKTFKKLQSGQNAVISGSAAGLLQKAEEIVKRIQNTENPEDKVGLGRLFSELLFVVFVLAEQHGVALEDSFLATVDEVILNSIS